MSDIPVGGGFYLKQFPTIPEPVTALLLAAAGLVADLRRRRGALRG
jgi:MprA protease rhombosortase-interaction domain-containing protein